MTDSGFEAAWPAPPGVRIWQTTRSGGVSRGTWSSLNLALHVGDDPQAVMSNRAELIGQAGLPGEPVWLEQVHGSRILDLDRGETGPADGAITARKGKVLVVMTADCLPVLLARKDGQQIAVAHAGWRGLAGGVLGAAVKAFGCDPSAITAWLGPAIGQSAFEVGDEVREAFVAIDSDAAEAFEPNARSRWQADLHRLGRRALSQAGVRQISGDASCTFGDAGRYFSHRRQAPCGRMASLIWREPEARS